MPSNLHQFLKLCLEMNTIEELEQLFELFLTLEEKDDLAKRLLIVQALLEKEQSQRDIAKSLQVSIAKITRGSNQLKVMSDHFKKLILQNMNQQKVVANDDHD
jgi:TrpR family trp operon transcriptional repressor